MLQLFPDELHCFGKTQIQLSGLGISGSTSTFKLNGPFNLFGPQVNNTGAFASNVPAGSNYALGTNVAAGSHAIYGRSTVVSSKCDIELIGISSNTLPISVVMFGSLNSSVSGLPIAQWREQKGAAYSQLSYNATSALKLSAVTDIAQIFGVSKDIVKQSPDYSQPPLVDPANLCYFHIYIASADGSTNQTWYCNVTFTHEYVFRGINTFDTVPPS